ncbi:MAG: DUF502 domain-containing protein [Rhizobiales bacterium]|nr:DUF502 domain-containing protein [Hyphomicrobiales bacterium]
MSERPEGDGGDQKPLIEQLRSAVGAPRRHKAPLGARLRSYFLTGLVIAAPISITVYVTWWFIRAVDTWFKPLLPAQYDPDTYLPFTIPGVGLVLALFSLTVLGALAANLFGRTVVRYGEQVLDQMPVVRNVYRALKQIFETVLSQSNQSFRQVGLIEYPRKGLWALVFISTETRGEVAERADGDGDMLSVFLPTTPNPTSGFLLFVPRGDIKILDMSVEEAAKLVISAGLVIPGEKAEEMIGLKGAQQDPRGKAQPAASKRKASSRSKT